MFEFDWLPAAWLDYRDVAGLIVFGAIAHTLNAFRLARADALPFYWDDTAIAFILAVFSGVFHTLLGSGWFNVDGVKLYALACGGAFLGITGTERLTDAALDRIFPKRGSS